MVPTTRRHGRSHRSSRARRSNVRVAPRGVREDAARSLYTYSSAGTIVWTAALAYAGVVLQANYEAVGDYMGVATVLLIGLGVMLIRRYIQCWMPRRA